MDLRFDGKTIIVTGGTSGIGAATCVELGASGATVIVAGRGMAKAENMVAQIVGGGGKAHAVQVDVADAVSVHVLPSKRPVVFTGWSTMRESVGHQPPRGSTISELGNR